MANNEWRIHENPAPDEERSFVIQDESFDINGNNFQLNDTNIWQVYDLLVSMGAISNSATVHSTIHPQTYEVERPEPEE